MAVRQAGAGVGCLAAGAQQPGLALALGEAARGPCEARKQLPAHCADFLVERCAPSRDLAVALHWSLTVEGEADGMRRRADAMLTSLYTALPERFPASLDAVQGQFRFKSFLDRISKAVRGPSPRSRSGAHGARCSARRALLGRLLSAAAR